MKETSLKELHEEPFGPVQATTGKPGCLPLFEDCGIMFVVKREVSDGTFLYEHNDTLIIPSNIKVRYTI